MKNLIVAVVLLFVVCSLLNVSNISFYFKRKVFECASVYGFAIISDKDEVSLHLFCVVLVNNTRGLKIIKLI